MNNRILATLLIAGAAAIASAQSTYWDINPQKSVFTTSERAYINIGYRGKPGPLRLEVFQTSAKAGIETSGNIDNRKPDTVVTPRLKPSGKNRYTYDAVTVPTGKPGIYVVRASMNGQTRIMRFIVSDLSMVLKKSSNKIVVWVLNRAASKPVAGAIVRMVPETGPPIEGRTGANGIWEGPGNASNLPITARYGEHFAALTPYGYRNENEGEDRIYLYTDRPVYRPGDTVFFKGIVRTFQNGGYVEVGGGQVEMELSRSYQEERSLLTATAQSDGHGSFSGELMIPKGTPPAGYQLIAKVGEELKGTADLSVAEYKKPEYKITLDFDKDPVVTGDSLTARVTAKYYFGAPLANSRVSWSAYVRESGNSWYEFLPEEDEGPSWETQTEERNYGSSYGWGETRIEGKGTTDANGVLLIKLPTTFSNRKFDQPLELSVSAEMLDIAGREGDVNGTATILPGEVFTHLETDTWVGKIAEPVDIKASSINALLRQTASNQSFGLQIIRSRWEKEGNRWVEHSDPKEDTTLQTGADGTLHRSFTPDAPGNYKLISTTRDAQGRISRFTEFVYVYGQSQDYYGWGSNETLNVVASVKRTNLGGHVTILFQPPVKQGSLWYSVEGLDIHNYGILPVQNGSAALEINVTDGLLPSFTVWGGICVNGQLREGQVSINVEDPTRILKVEVVPDSQQHLPGEDTTYRVVTKDSNDRPVPADYSLQVVDESIYAIRSDTTEDIRGFFYGPKRNQVSTTHTEDLDRQIQSAAARVQRKEMRDMDTLANKAEAAGIKLRRDFRDTAFWAPSLQTDETGRGSSSFKLPDNLTQWRATVRAVGSNTSVGQATNADLRVSKPLIASLNLPRFVTKGDTFRIIAVVRNTSDHVQSVSLEVQTEGGIELTSKPATQISIPAKGEWRYDIEAAAAQEGTASLLMIAKGSTDSDAVLKQLDIQQYATWRTKTDAGTASQSVEGTAAFPTGRNSGSESLTFRLSPSLTGMILGSVDQLATYPYGCIEQTTSPTLADLALLRVVNASNSPDQKLTARLDDMIKVGIQRIYNHQNYDGGWGWGDHSEGDLYWTSYVMDALQQAKAAGYAIDDNVMQRGGRQLSAMVMAADDTKPVHKTNQTKDEYEAAVWQYRYNLHAKLQGLVVAAKESPDSWSAAFDRMVTKSDDLGNAGIAMLAMGLDEVGKHAEARSIMNRLMAYRSGQGNFAYWKSDRGSEYGYWYYFGEQDTYATAEVLRAILRMDPKNPVVAKVINWLTANRLGGYWVSTNDTAKIATAFAEYLAANPQRDFHGKVSVLVNGAVAKETDLAASSQPQEIVVTVGADKLTQNRAAWEIRLDGQGEVRYSVTEKYSVPWEQKTATASGIGITRYYYKLGKSITTHTENNYTWSEDAYKLLSAGNAFSPGDEVVVKLIVQSDAPMRHVLLEDPMPAGLEPIDEENSQYLYADWLIGRGDQEEGRFNYYGYAQREQHENRTVMLLEDLGDGRSVFYYVLRAVTPGDFRSAPPVATQMYLPSITGTGTSSAIKVRPK